MTNICFVFEMMSKFIPNEKYFKNFHLFAKRMKCRCGIEAECKCIEAISPSQSGKEISI